MINRRLVRGDVERKKNCRDAAIFDNQVEERGIQQPHNNITITRERRVGVSHHPHRARGNANVNDSTIRERSSRGLGAILLSEAHTSSLSTSPPLRKTIECWRGWTTGSSREGETREDVRLLPAHCQRFATARYDHLGCPRIIISSVPGHDF